MDTLILRLEHEIVATIGADNGCTVHFEYGQCDSTTPKNPGGLMNVDYVASAITINPITNEPFLLKTEQGDTKEKALKAILEYVKKQKGLNSFTVIWMKKGDSKSNTSYFYCHDILDVVEKFFFGKNRIDYVIHEIKLNPAA